MADEDVATRAPESDAAADTPPAPPPKDEPPIPPAKAESQAAEPTSLVPGDTPAQSGPTMGEHCTTDRALPTDADNNARQPSGELSALGDVACYISKPADYPHAPGKLLLLLTGGTGLHSVNNQLQADAFAARGFVVVMPDQFNGDAAPKTSVTMDAPSSPTSELSLLDRVKMGAAETAKSFLIDMWLARHTPEKVMPVLEKVLGAAKEEFADALANGGGLYGVGYCFGAKYVLLLAAEAKGEGEEEKKRPALRAGAIAHGTLVTKEDIEGVKAPVAMACVENDSLFPDAVREQGRASLELNAVEHEIKVFEGVPHGFAVVGDYNDAGIHEKQKEAFEMMCGWLEGH